MFLLLKLEVYRNKLNPTNFKEQIQPKKQDTIYNIT